MPAHKKPKILQDKDNLAIRTAGMQSLQPGRAVLFGASEIAHITDGIRSLQAEREFLRKLVKEAFQDGMDTYKYPNDPDDAWAASAFPEKIARSWDV